MLQINLYFKFYKIKIWKIYIKVDIKNKIILLLIFFIKYLSFFKKKPDF